MRILVSCVPFDNGKSGISVYMRSIVAELEKRGHSLTLVLEPDAKRFFPNFDSIDMPSWAARPLFSMLYHLFILPFRIRRSRFDLCILAAANRRALCFNPVFTVAVVHDLSQYHIKTKYDAFRMFYIKHLLPAFVRRADAISAISYSTSRDLENFWRIPPHKTKVNYNGLSLYSVERPGWTAANGLKKGEYILYISRIEHPGKNHVNLIKAFERLPEPVREKYTLVFGGSDWTGADAVHKAAEKSPAAAQIRFMGFIDEPDMPEAYRNSACYVFPSFFEGFGLSLIEAMYYGTPCCASNTSSLGEIGRDAAMLFPPDDPDAIAEALKAVLTEPELRAKLVKAGRRRAGDFSWNKHVSGLLSFYDNRQI